MRQDCNWQAGSWKVRGYGIVACVAALFLGLAGQVRAESTPTVVLNEINCEGTDWVELFNAGDEIVGIGEWLFTDDPLEGEREDHRHYIPLNTSLDPGERLVISRGEEGFPFGISCGNDTLRLASSEGVLVDEVDLPVTPSSGGATYGRLPDGTGEWDWNLPTQGEANLAAPDTRDEDPAWLFDPLAPVTELDFNVDPVDLEALNEAPRSYVPARITIQHGGETAGPYLVGLRLKGRGSFRPLTGKAAFKVKFHHLVSGQRFSGLKGLTLNNMVQDHSHIAEAVSSRAIRSVGAPTARVGYAFVRLNGAEYGLYANVETVDSVMARRWFAGTHHLFEGEYGVDIGLREGELQVDEGSESDLSDLARLSAAAFSESPAWFEDMQEVAEMESMLRVWALEHYVHHWDGYSVSSRWWLPNNYYLHSDYNDRFSMIPTGTDQTWAKRAHFGDVGNGVLFRLCIEDETCRNSYVQVLSEIAPVLDAENLPALAQRIRANISLWIERDPRREATLSQVTASADAKTSVMAVRPDDLVSWLSNPSFRDVAMSEEPPAEEPPAEEPPAVNPAKATFTKSVSMASVIKRGRKVRVALQLWNTGDASVKGLLLQLKGQRIMLKRGLGSLPQGRTKTVRLRLRFPSVGKVRLTFRTIADNAEPKVVRRTIKVIR